MRTKKKKRGMQLAAVGCLVFLLAGCNNQAGFYVEQQQEDQTETGEETPREDASEEMEPEPIYVQVGGAVVSPGVYQLPQGSRIFEAVEKAGGTSETADLNSLNQAQLLQDGQLVYVYAQGEWEDQTAREAVTEDDGRVNLNTASAQELMTLPGIGQSKAESIISYREKNGAFERVEDIMNIEGIKEGVFSKIEDQIKVN